MSEVGGSRESALSEVYNRFAEWVKTGEIRVDFIDPEIEFDLSHVFPDRGTVQGIEPFRKAILDYANAFEEWTIEPKEFLRADEDRVVALVRDGGQIRGVDRAIYNDFTHLWTFRGDTIVAWAGYRDRKEALEAAGLSE